MSLLGVLAWGTGCGSSSSKGGTESAGGSGGGGSAATGGSNTSTDSNTSSDTGSNTTITTNSNTNSTTNSGTGTSIGPDAGATTSTCNWPSCLAVAGPSCLPGGTCIQQGETSTGNTNVCYSNGVKEISTVDTAYKANITVKNGSTTCFTMSGNALAALGGGNLTLTLKNAAGAVIGTLTQDSKTSQQTVTCTGGQPVVLSSTCIPGASSSNSCAKGACSP